MCNFLQLGIVIGLTICHLTDAVPIVTNFNDDWNFEISSQNSPILNESQKVFLEPFYSFVNDMKVQGLQDNDTDSSDKAFTPRNARIVGDIIRTKLSCSVCNLGVGLLFREVQVGTPFDEIKAKFVSLCVTFKIEIFSVCSGIFDVYGPEVIPVIQLSNIDSSNVCKLIFGEICLSPEVPSHDWNVKLPMNPKPAFIKLPLSQVGQPIFKILHLSDTHYDLDYAEGSVANCQEPLCCRGYSTPKDDEELVPAGRWGSYEKCDAPKVLLENMLEHISLQHPDIDYILWTGDLPPHDIWNQTKEYNLKVIRETVELVTKAFPNKPIFPAIGNHESSPAGNFAPPWMTDPAHSVQWLYHEITNSWSQWLPSTTEQTVSHGAFYSVLLRPGFRLISLNTNYCHALSWWLFLNSTDPASELQWLIHELSQAESKGEKVHIIGHIAPGSTDCMKTWSKNFYDIVNRFESTIMGLFYGHSHADEFEVFYETEKEFNSKSSFNKRLRWWKSKNIKELKFTDRPTAVAYLGPSVTSYTNNNPAYRIYYVDGDHENTTREILDHETWTFDLGKANLNDNRPSWYKLYSAREAYEMKNLRPEEWNNLIERLSVDEELFNKFYRNYHRNSPENPVCDSKCRVQILCDLKSAKSHNRRYLCHELEAATKM
ncbi:hypothetical protein ABEB36_005267 [Hypothenemus hampei]|uniref:Sphingomyelin phosphodiesterase n=1 Tax=Hypothenemus hampei TaxID=57062 RepID=A0ABD1EY84_HYPHA